MKWAYVGSDPDPNDKDQMAEERSVTRNIFLQWTFRCGWTLLQLVAHSPVGASVLFSCIAKPSRAQLS